MKINQFKQWLLTLTVLLLGSVSARAAVEEGTDYLLHLNGTDLYFSAESANAGANAELTLQAVGAAGFDQAVVFTKNSDGYNITVGGKFMVVRDSWYMRYKNIADVNATDKNALFDIEETADGIQLKNHGSGKYVGCDSRNTGSKLYSDKTGDKVCVFALETLDDQFYKDRLTGVIAEAKNLLATTEEGTGSGQYTAEVRAALSDAITAAESALESDVETVKAATQTLTAAMEQYLASRNPIEFVNGFYRFAYKGISGTYMSNGWQANSWEPDNVMSTGIILEEGEQGYNQQFMVTRTEAGAAANGYNLRDKDGYYMFNKDGNFVYEESNMVDPNSADAIFLFEEDGQYIRIVNAATGKYVGPVDNTIGWTWIHLGTNYSGPVDGCRFTVEFLSADVAGMLSEVIAEAQNLLDTTEEGNEPGQYTAVVREALANAIAAARTALEGADEDQMMTAVNDLKLAMETYKEHVVAAFFQEGVYKFYHVANPGAVLASGWHANSWESSNVEHTALILNESEAGEYNTEFTVRKAPETAEYSGYNIIDNENIPLVSGAGKLLVDEEATLDETIALFVFDVDGENVRIRSLMTKKYVGPVDNTKGWSWIHAGTTHTGTDNGDLFRYELLQESGLSNVLTENEFSVSVYGNNVGIAGVESAVVYSVTGARVAEISANATVAVQPGVYVVVSADGQDRKIMVK